MKKFIKILFVVILSLFTLNVSAKDDSIQLYYGYSCPHCRREKVFLAELKEKYDSLAIEEYEVYKNRDNESKMLDEKERLGVKQNGVPFLVIGDDYVLGYMEEYNEKIENLIVEYLGIEKIDDINTKDNNDSKEDNSNSNDDNKKDNVNNENKEVLPFLGKIDVKNTSLVLMSIVIGLVDGFNPCAMWVLLFLISSLLGMENKKRKWILGITFLVASAFVYMLIMMSWLKIAESFSASVMIRTRIAIIAIVGALFNLYGFYKSVKVKDVGCNVTSVKKRKSIFEKIKKFTKEQNFILALIGVITLAVSVNIVELACSAGLPMLFSSILAINNIHGFTAFVYTLLYILFFLLDDIIVFVIAMLTLKVSGISNKYSKYSKLIGGILMLIIGVLLIVKPEWIMFNF